MKYSVQVKFTDFDGKVREKALPTNNMRCGNYLFEAHKGYPDTLSVKLKDNNENTLRQWVRL